MRLNLPTLAEIERERTGPLTKPLRKTAAARVEGHRDAKGWRTAAKRNKFGEATQAGDKAVAKRHENAVKAETRAKVWARSGGVCEACGDSESVTATKSPKATHEAHEVVPRSLTRGLAPEFRFSTENTARLCQPCHKDIQQHRREFHFLSDLRMDGPFQIVPGRAA